ncbi:MAG: GNAT family N-acetyltransferase [Bacteroidetes bacterium]|nr:GNAT family N-acetyltransferase [Bacteroidota bacterium]
MSCLIRPAEPRDVTAIHQLIYELAVYEKAPHEMVNTPEKLLEHGFGAQPLFICFVAELNQKVVGMSLNYVRYSTWKGPVLYLEDLIITESQRGKGFGKALFLHTLEYARMYGYARLQWQVLDWNTPAVDFYKSFDAGFDGEWLNAWIEF